MPDAQKKEMAEATGLSQTQINNWYINQRKRHWNRFFKGALFQQGGSF